jgi:hypothetical protein
MRRPGVLLVCSIDEEVESDMNVDLRPEIEDRLSKLAQQSSRSVPDLVEEAIAFYLDTWEHEPSAWVKVTQEHLPDVWPTEDFSDWMPPRDR